MCFNRCHDACSNNLSFPGSVIVCLKSCFTKASFIRFLQSKNSSTKEMFWNREALRTLYTHWLESTVSGIQGVPNVIALYFKRPCTKISRLNLYKNDRIRYFSPCYVTIETKCTFYLQKHIFRRFLKLCTPQVVFTTFSIWNASDSIPGQLKTSMKITFFEIIVHFFSEITYDIPQYRIQPFL